MFLRKILFCGFCSKSGLEGEGFAGIIKNQCMDPDFLHEATVA